MKTSKQVISNVATVGATLSLGLLSFAGMLVFSPSIALASMTALLAMTVEGAVYRQNIFEAMKKLGQHRKVIERSIAKRELKKLKHLSDNIFIQDYYAQKDYLHELEESHGKFNRANEAIAKKEIAQVKARIARLEDLYILSLRNKNSTNATLNTDTKGINLSLRALVNQSNTLSSKDLNQEIKRKDSYMKIALGVSIGSGIAAGLVTFASVQTFFLTVGMSLGSAMIIGAPLIGFAAFGYTLLMYRTISDMIQNDTLQKWAAKFHNLRHTPKKDRNAAFYAKLAGGVALISLATFATVATAGTWWYLARSGAKSMRYLPRLGAKIISISTWALMIVPNLLWNLVNALKSIKLIPGIVKNITQNTIHDLKKTWKKENVFQFFNPFRIALKIFNGTFYSLHLISIGITTDQIPWLNEWLTTTTNSAMEGLNDLHYVTSDHQEHHHAQTESKAHQESGKHRHSSDLTTHDNCGHNHTHADGHKYMQTEDHEHSHNHASTHSHKHGHTDINAHTHSHAHTHDSDDEHSHTHGDFILNTIRTFFNYLSTSWDWMFSKNDWQTSKLRFFPEAKLPLAPQLSKEVSRYDIHSRLNQLSKHYRNEGLGKKARAFAELRSTIEINSDDTLPELPEAIALKEHRHTYRLFKQKAPASQVHLDNIRSDRSYTATAG